MNLEEERKAFEEFYLKEFGDDYVCPYAQLDKRNGEYIDFHAQDTWVTWLASANREGYKLVPVEPTEKMIVASFAHRDCGDDYCIADIYKEMIGACDE